MTKNAPRTRTPSGAPPLPAVRTTDDDRVLDAAAVLIKRHGYAATSVREIARAAGMLPGSLHYRFPSKEALLVALMERAIVGATAAVRKAVAHSSDPAERLRLGLRAHLRLLLSGDASFHVLLYDWRSLDAPAKEPMSRLLNGYESFWDGLLFEAAGSGLARPNVDVQLVRQFGFGAVNWVAQWWDPSSGRTPDEIANAFWAWLAFGLLADDRRPRDVDAAVARLMSGKPMLAPESKRRRRTTPARTTKRRRSP